MVQGILSGAVEPGFQAFLRQLFLHGGNYPWRQSDTTTTSADKLVYLYRAGEVPCFANFVKIQVELCFIRMVTRRDG